MTLRIARMHFDRMRQDAEASYPREACGVLLGQPDASGRRWVRGIVQCSNTCLESPRTRYRIDAAELVRIQRQAREAGQAILGFYHSHPDHPARWSPADLEEAHWSGCCYLITGTEAARAVQTQCFVLLGAGDGKRFEEEPIEVY